MTNAEVLNLMMKRLGNRSATSLRAVVLQELNEKIKQLEAGAVIPWFMEDRYTGNTVVDQDYIDLPTGFIREVEEGKFKLQNSAGCWTSLTKVTLEALEDETENADAAIPEGYAIFGNKIYLGPVPELAYSFKLPYYKRTTAIVDNTADVTNSWILEFFNYTTLSALSVVANLHVQSADIAMKIAPELAKATDAFWRSIEARMHVNMDYLLDNSES